ncbi:MAG: thioredoxin family protein [Candidatus Pacebacteria bacterium]|nr:thioredoxin family protein [Candidatus Paceibacterota bacterium]
MKKIFALIIVLVIGVGLYAYNSNFMYPVRDVETFEKTSTKNEEVKENTIDLEVDIDNQVSKPGTYEEYSANKIIEKGESGRVLLFFYASWCPSCRSLDKDINKNLSNIPENLTILKTNYDKEGELKAKYKVTYQHTLVEVDREGNMLKKWTGGDFAEILKQIN